MSYTLIFRLTAATIAFFDEQGHQVVRAIPRGSVIRVNSLPAEDFVEVVWEGKTALMFSEDVRERTERIIGAA
jgi:hypothetical protein